MGIHQAIIGGYSNATSSAKTWTIVGSDSSNGFTGATVSVTNCQVGDQVWYAWTMDIGGSTAYNPAGYTQVRSNSDSDPDYFIGRKTITSNGTETVNVATQVDNAIIMGFRSSTGSISNTFNGNSIYAFAENSLGMPTIPSANFNNLQHPSGALALCIGLMDDDNPVNLGAPTGYNFLVAGNVDDGTTSSSVFVATTETTSASSTPPGAGNAWTATSQNSDAWELTVDYLQHGS
tara:strand:- start:513 stop:1214 length:702 start_codon:yes stop_codon:yes gene_type:complete